MDKKVILTLGALLIGSVGAVAQNPTPTPICAHKGQTCHAACTGLHILCQGGGDNPDEKAKAQCEKTGMMACLCTGEGLSAGSPCPIPPSPLPDDWEDF